MFEKDVYQKVYVTGCILSSNVLCPFLYFDRIDDENSKDFGLPSELPFFFFWCFHLVFKMTINLNVTF